MASSSLFFFFFFFLYPSILLQPLFVLAETTALGNPTATMSKPPSPVPVSTDLHRCLTDPRVANFTYSNVFRNDSNANITVLWTGNDDRDILVVTLNNGGKPSTLYRSSTFGKSFENATDRLQGLAVASVQQHPNDRKRVLLVASNTLFLTVNGGGDLRRVTLPFRVLEDIRMHSRQADRLLALGSPERSHERQAWVSSDFGVTWTLVHASVDDAQWARSESEGNTTFYLTNGTDPSKALDLLKTEDLGKKFYVIAKHVKSFQAKGRFLYISVYSDEAQQRSKLKVSTDGGNRWNEAQLPVMTDDQFYRVLDMSEGMVFIHVDQKGDTGYGTLFTSDADGIVFSESLRRHLYPNRERIHDFYKVSSIRGVYLTSQLNNDHSSVQTLITSNRGASWRPVRRPSNVDCPSSAKKCFLQISSTFSAKRNVPVPMGPLSTKSAVGVILAHGHVGNSLMVDEPSVFVSSDGGYNWLQALKGPHLYAIADHGGLLVAVSTSHPATDTLKFSLDEGQSWQCHKFSADKVRVTGLLTDPESWSLKVGVWGYGVDDSLWRVTVVDFQPVLGPKCRHPQDFEDFEPHREPLTSDETSGCLLGLRETFRKIKKGARCYLGPSHTAQSSRRPCKCTEEDFECDFGYYRATSGAPCVENPAFKGQKLDICLNDERTEIVTSGYRRVPGDECLGGFDPGTSYQKDTKQKCHDSNGKTHSTKMIEE